MACKSDRKCGKIIEGNLFSHDNSLIWSKYVPLPVTEIPSNSIYEKIDTHISGTTYIRFRSSKKDNKSTAKNYSYKS